MAEKIVSPGVFTRENDLSFLQQGVANIGAAFIGPFKEGPLTPTIVNSQAAVPGSNSEGQLRYKTNVDIKIDTSALEGDIKAAIKQIIADIKEIPGVVEFKVLPKAKETTPY